MSTALRYIQPAKHIYEIEGVKYDSIDVIINVMLQRDIHRIATGGGECPLCMDNNGFNGICRVDRYSSARARVLFVPKHIDLDTITSFVIQRFGVNQTVVWIQNIGIKPVALSLLETVLLWLSENTDWKIDVRICVLQPIDNPARGKVRRLMTILEKFGGTSVFCDNVQSAYSIDCSHSVTNETKKEEKKHG